MWIWIGVGIWLVCGLIAYRGEMKGSGSLGLALFAFFMGPLGILCVLGSGGHPFRFKRRTKMKKIYWDENLQQIRTKGRKCLMDKNHQQSINDSDSRRISNLQGRVQKLENITKTVDDGIAKGIAGLEKWATNRESTIKKQLQCSAKGHKMVFNRQGAARQQTSLTLIDIFSGYVFKCSICGLEITKTEKELSAVEKEALKKLKLL